MVGHDGDGDTLLWFAATSDLSRIAGAKLGGARERKASQVLENRALSRRLIANDNYLRDYWYRFVLVAQEVE